MKQKFAIVAGVFIALLLIVVGLPVHEAAGVGMMGAVPLAFLDIEKNIRSLKEQRGVELDAMDALVDLGLTEKRDLTTDEDTKFVEARSKAESLNKQIERLETSLESRKLRITAEGKTVEDTSKRNTTEETEKRYMDAVNNYIRKGESRCSQEDRDIIDKYDTEKRAMGTTPNDAGGYTVPTTMAAKIEDALKSMGGVRTVANVVPTNNGAIMNFPTSNDVDEEGEILGENSADETSEKDIKFGNKQVSAYTFSSKAIVVANELLQDSGFDIAGFIAEKAAQRIFKITNRMFTTGTGTNQPEGFLTAATKGVDAAVAGLTYDDLLKLQHAVVVDYRLNGVWMFNDQTLLAIRMMKDNDGKPLWQEGLRVGEPATILGKPYIVNNNMPVVGASAKSVAFGDFKKYLIRDVAGAAIQRFVELKGLKNQTAFCLFSRHDGKLIDAGTAPIKYLQHAAS